MSVYLQFDSSSRSDPYIRKNIGGSSVWVPNDNYANTSAVNPYQNNKSIIQTPTNYKVYYRELNDANNVRTIGFLANCKERPVNLNYSVEMCTLIIPGSALIRRTDSAGTVTYVSVLDEPYLYVRMLPITNSEGNLIYSNNSAADAATFMVWLDKIQLGTSTDLSEIPRPTETILPLTERKWLIYKSCMITVMRLDLQADEWQIRIYDRFGNDVILAEDDNGGVGFGDLPAVTPDIQTTLLVGIKPNYPL